MGHDNTVRVRVWGGLRLLHTPGIQSGTRELPGDHAERGPGNP